MRTTRAYSILSALLLFATISLAAAGEPLAEGEWTKKSAAVDGSWSIVEEGGVRYLLLDDDFKTKKAPDLKLLLSPRDLSGLTGENATDRAVRIGKLESVRGAQRYAIPNDVDLGKYATLVLHCEKYSKLWGGATLH